jgi:DnaJ-like protein
MEDRDPRAVLGLPLDATRAEAQRAFRRLAKQTHPDAGGDAAHFRTVAGAWADLVAVLPPLAAHAALVGGTPPVPRGADSRPAALSPHVQAYREPASRVLWAETRRPVRRDFAALLDAEMARLAV